MTTLTPITSQQADSPDVRRYRDRISELCLELDQLVMSPTRSSTDAARQQSIQTQISSVELLLTRCLQQTSPPDLPNPTSPLVRAPNKEKVIEFAKHLSDKRPFKTSVDIPNPCAYLKYFDQHAINFNVSSDSGKFSALQLANASEKQVMAFLSKFQERDQNWTDVKNAFIDRFEPFDFKEKAARALRAFCIGRFERYADFATRYEAFLIDYRLKGDEFLGDFTLNFNHPIMIDAFATAKVSSLASAIDIVMSKDHLSPQQALNTTKGLAGSKNASYHKPKGFKKLVRKFNTSTSATNEINVNALSGANKDGIQQYITTTAFFISAKVNGIESVLLLDSGSGANVISAVFAEKNNIHKRLLKQPLTIRVANGIKMQIQYCCRINIACSSFSRELNFLVAPITTNVILGTPFFSNINVQKLHFPYYIAFVERRHPIRVHKWQFIQQQQRTPIDVLNIEVHNWDQLLESDDNAFLVELSAIKSNMGTDAKNIVQEFTDVFADPTSLPLLDNGAHEIQLSPNAKLPKRAGQRNISQEDLSALKETLDELVAKGFIRPSSSPVAAPILFVRKKDGSRRLCIDYRLLNAITVPDATTPPLLSTLHDRLVGANFFSKFDARNGFYNIRMAPQDIWKTAFTTRYGSFEFVVMPFGLRNAPATFTRVIQNILSPLLDVCVINYLDDILVYSKTKADHRLHVRQVMDLLRKHKVHLKLEKCLLFARETTFCGMTISADGIKPDYDYLESIRLINKPSNKKELQSFLGVVNWLRDYIPRLAEIALPLFKLISKDSPFIWTEDHSKAFDMIKKSLIQPPLLKFFDPTLPTAVYTDASNFAIGGYLAQTHGDKEYPVLYWSRKLLPAECNYPTHELELLALVEFLKKTRHYLVGLKFIANTDHKSLIWLNTQPFLSKRQANWVSFLQEFDFSIQYLPGPDNSVADILSRNSVYAPHCHKCNKKVEVSLSSINVTLSLESEISLYSTTDPFIQKLNEWSQDQTKVPVKQKAYFKRFTQNNGIWNYNRTRIVVPDKLVTKILELYHSGASSQHLGLTKVLERIEAFYYWPKLRESVKSFIRTCDACQRNSIDNQCSPGLLHPLSVPDSPLTDIEMDFAEMPLSVEGFDFLLVIVDRLTKFTVLSPCHKADSIDTIASIFIRDWYKRFGLPGSIVSDRDTRFTSEFWTAVCRILKIDLKMSTPRHHQTPGQVERRIRDVKQMFRKSTNYDQNNWTQDLPLVEFALNNHVSESTKEVPFELVLPLRPRALPCERVRAVNKSAREFIIDVNRRLEKAKKAMKTSQEKQVKWANQHRSVSPVYCVGDDVLVKSEGLMLPADSERSAKLLPRWLGPFKVIAVDPVLPNCTININNTMPGVHPVFHVDRLKKFHSPLAAFPTRTNPTFPVQYDRRDGLVHNAIERVEDVRTRRNKTEFLLKFVGQGPEHNKWVAEDQFTAPKLVEDFYERIFITPTRKRSSRKKKP